MQMQETTKNLGDNNTNVLYAPSPINVILAADNNYAMPLSVTLRSIVDNLPIDTDLNVFVIDGGISNNNKSRISSSISSKTTKIEWIRPDSDVLGKVKMPSDYHLSIATLFRIFIPFYVPKSMDKIIYLDCDLILNRNLEELWNCEVDDNYLLAVQDMATPYVSSKGGLEIYKELGISAGKKYFNGGVLLINLRKWRSDNISQQAVDFLNHNSNSIRWLDQDALNVVVKNQWETLDPRWNQQRDINQLVYSDTYPFSGEILEGIKKDPFIIHFTTFKPWNSVVEHPFRDKFFEYLDLTAWAGYRYRLHQQVWDKLIYKFRRLIKLVKSLL
jgi:lipopolysaccharide biosynthesis glycosyltransferase